jgi:DNA-binding transcriptional ArsR family regulator
MARNGFVVEQPRQLKALASAVRVEIVDALAGGGPATMAELAERLGRPQDGLYFHVRQLLRVGLLLELEPQREGRHVAARFDVPGRPVTIRQKGSPTDQVRRIVSSALRMGQRDFQRYIDSRPEKDPLRAAWGGRLKGWITAKELARLNKLLDQIQAMLTAGKRRPGTTLQSLAFVTSPVPGRKSGKRGQRRTQR